MSASHAEGLPLTPPQLIERYAARPPFEALSYATVRDYCDSADVLPDLANRVGDLKDVQRPWAVKAVLNAARPPARVLEIGGGEPLVASVLVSLGYPVTLVDPFDGSGRGPTEFDVYRKCFPGVEMIRSYFDPAVARALPQPVDVILSISVLEHVNDLDALQGVFDAVEIALVPGGASIHIVDMVLEGPADRYHRDHLVQVIGHQHRIAGDSLDAPAVEREVDGLLARCARDLETYYLSAYGHNLWRGGLPYDQFPFRKCVSVHSIVRRKA